MDFTRVSRAARTVFVGVMLTLASAVPTFAAISVNNSTISDLEISQRAKLLQLEGRSNGATAAARQELIDEAIKMQEAQRLGITVSEAQIDEAVLNVARNVRLSNANLEQIFNQAGVPISTLRARLRVAIAWNQVVQTVVQARVQVSEADIEQQAESRVTPAMSFDYVLKEVIFVVPTGQGSAGQRTGDANRYRAAFQGCDTAVQLSLNYRDAAVLEMGRRHATQLPEAVAQELAGLNVGGITRPRVVENGVSMLAVCSKTVAEDTTFIREELRQEAGNAALEQEAERYLAELRERAVIN